MSAAWIPWLQLLAAGLLEIGWALGLKYSEGFSRPLPSAVTIMLMIASFWLLALAIRHIPIGTAYAVWTGIGAVGMVVVGMLLFNESREWYRMVFVGLIVVGIVGLKLSTTPAS